MSFQLALEASDQCEPLWQRAEAILGIARRLESVDPQPDLPDLLGMAVRYAHEGEESPSRQDSLDASSVLGEIAEQVALSGDRPAGYEIARGIRNWAKRKSALARIRTVDE